MPEHISNEYHPAAEDRHDFMFRVEHQQHWNWARTFRFKDYIKKLLRVKIQLLQLNLLLFSWILPLVVWVEEVGLVTSP